MERLQLSNLAKDGEYWLWQSCSDSFCFPSTLFCYHLSYFRIRTILIRFRTENCKQWWRRKLFRMIQGFSAAAYACLSPRKSWRFHVHILGCGYLKWLLYRESEKVKLNWIAGYNMRKPTDHSNSVLHNLSSSQVNSTYFTKTTEHANIIYWWHTINLHRK